MRAAPFRARWQLELVADHAWEARWRLDDDRLFAGHYPRVPILPGSFLVEALVQAAEMALGADLRLAEIVAARFHSPLHPGDELVARFTSTEPGDATLDIQAASTRTQAATVRLQLVHAGLAARGRGKTATVSAAGDDWSGARRLDQGFIHGALPHRAPALLVDSARLLDAPPRLVAYRSAALAEASPPLASYPEMLVVESFCQACGLLRAATSPAVESRDRSGIPVVAKLAGLRFLADAGQGEELEHHVQLVVRTEEGAVFSGQTVAAGQVILEVGRVVAAMAPTLVRA